ncbi:hypothetical protein [Exiguobacterium sp. S3]|uniref:hypothetical protein n=1 Tax=Exiguobacterium sp. S3 TaxID=483245 RepID=UPI001BEC6E27|nr:hypothetical protein [Exiguobacterium sp. S3]
MGKLSFNILSYVHALRPIIYIPHNDFNKMDHLLEEVAGTDFEILEFNHAYGCVDFRTKVEKENCSLEHFLRYADDLTNPPCFLVLRDVHRDLDDPKIQALLKSIARKNSHESEYYCTIFIVSTELHIPKEIESLVTIVDVPSPNYMEIKKMILEFANVQSIMVDESIIDEMALSFKGLSEYEIIQILNLAYQSNGTLSETDKNLILKEK